MDINNLYKETVELIKTNRFNEALEKINSVENEDANVFFLRGKIYLHLNKLDQAEENLKFAAKLDKNNSSIFHNLGFISISKKDIQSAKSYYLKAIKIKENINLLNDLANLYIEEKNYDTAQNYLERALEIDKNNKKAIHAMSHVFMMKNDYKKAYYYINKSYGLIRFTEKGVEII